MAVVAVSPVAPVSTQDASRICLSEAALHARLSNDSCLAASTDRAVYHGRLYSDKAPGLSLLEVPSTLLLSPGPAARWSQDDLRLWGVRALSVGLALLVCAFIVGRVSEGLAPGYGGIALVTFGLGTLLTPLAGQSFENATAAAFGLGAFLLAWSRRPGLAGLAAGAAVLVEYECGVIVIALGCYVALQGWRPLWRFVVGLVPAAVILGAYDWAAFGAPWHLSYRYVANVYAGFQDEGFFGIGLPHVVGFVEVFAGNAGLIVLSPVLVMAVFGLVRLGRDYPAEAVVAAVIAAVYIVVNCGYFQPYGGGSPGPRFLATGLPFLALGLGRAFSWRPRLTLALAVLSIIPVTAVTLTWSSFAWMSGTVWVQLAHVPAELSSSTFVRSLSANALSALGPGREWGAAMIGVAALAAVLVAARAMPWAEIRAHRWRGRPLPRPTWRTALIAGACVYAVAVSDVSAFANYPYDGIPQPQFVVLHTSISAPSHDSYEGGEINFETAVVDNGPLGAGGLSLHIALSPGLVLVGRPTTSLGGSCTGSSTLDCGLGGILAKGKEVITVFFGVQITELANQQVTAYADAPSVDSSNLSAFAITVGK